MASSVPIRLAPYDIQAWRDALEAMKLTTSPCPGLTGRAGRSCTTARSPSSSNSATRRWRSAGRRLPEVDGDKPRRSKFKRYPLGYFHIDIAEVHTEEGRLHLLVAIDRTTKFAFAELHEKVTRRIYRWRQAGVFDRVLRRL